MPTDWKYRTNAVKLSKKLEELQLEQTWAQGCDDCKFGIVLAPELTGAVALHMERLIHLLDGELTLCDCKAGVRYKSYLLNINQRLIEEARKHPMMQEQARRLSHADIENARWKIAQYRAEQTPTMHYEGERVTA